MSQPALALDVPLDGVDDLDNLENADAPIGYTRNGTPRKRKPKRNIGSWRNRKQLLDMQLAMHSLALDEKIAPSVRAQCARAWSDLQERLRVIDNKPLPGQLRPDLQQARPSGRVNLASLASITVSKAS